ncbi:gas vesicle protein GvpO [Phaeacidiphilus oryzae]|jgi:hypothetical protein|uniref:gas vesicle protein GvpO n=1 Tax=Phaeacidiphilus oryzae TaxID=348818 RepID=UPI0005672EA1|nr:gas vesicle protein [Phaeacidiphilus oryzae]
MASRPASESDDRDQPPRIQAAKAVRAALEQLGVLLGREPEGVSALAPQDSGWTVEVEVVELYRVPDSTSVLATYTVDLDGDGELLGYRRVRRYTRGQVNRD